jgi:hypothetical protein
VKYEGPVLYFVSGASAPADVRGLAHFSVPLGVSVSELSKPALRVLLGYWARPLLRVFVDSGAFSEVDRRGAVVAPITDDAWVARVRVMHQIAAAFGPPAGEDYGPRVWVVAPDRVGDQPETLRRLALHAEAMRACRALGARVVVPIQRGALTAAAFDAACCEALGFGDFTRGIPGNKVAMPAEELEGFLRARRPDRVHLLGVGPRGATYEPLTTLVRRVLGEVEMSCDSNAIAASVGKTNGAGGGPRAVTNWQNDMKRGDLAEMFPHRSREMALRMHFGAARLHHLTIARMREEGHLSEVKPAPVQMDLFDAVGG